MFHGFLVFLSKHTSKSNVIKCSKSIQISKGNKHKRKGKQRERESRKWIKPLTHAAQIFAIVLPFMLLFTNKWDRNNQKQKKKTINTINSTVYLVKNKEKRKKKIADVT